MLLAGLGAGLVLICLVAAGTGQVHVSPAEVLGSVLHRLGLPVGPLPSAAQGENALWVVRFPRVSLAVVVGASLGCAGALMQGVFGNPLAEPGVIGVSSGAAVGAAATIVTGVATLGGWTVAAAAFVTGLLTTVVVYAMSRADGRTEVVTLVLTGIAVNAVAGAVLGLLMFFGDADAVRAIASGSWAAWPRPPGAASRSPCRAPWSGSVPPWPPPASWTCSRSASDRPGTSVCRWNDCDC